MIQSTRRTFLSTLGGGAALGVLGAQPLARTRARTFARRSRDLTFGALEPLASLVQATEPDALQRKLIEHIRGGESLDRIVAATALANARAFGGEEYTGYHCLMALIPAIEMSRELARESAGAASALPVLKVVYRTSTRIHETGNDDEDTLRRAPEPNTARSRDESLALLRHGMEARDVEAAEQAFAELCTTPRAAYDDVQSILRESLDVHRIVLLWRAWELTSLTGEENAATMLRQFVRYCVDWEDRRVSRGRPEPVLRTFLPELERKYGLASCALEGTARSDADVAALARTVFASKPEDAAVAVAAALHDGWSANDVGEALSLAANTLLLNDPGRKQDEPGKPRGSVHGASVGVHASDAARAWRNLAATSNRRNAALDLVAGAYHTAGQSGHVGDDPFPYEHHLDDLADQGHAALLERTRAAIEDGDQSRACAAAQRYGETGGEAEPLFDLCLEYATSEDGALHAEKYYYTVREEFAAARPVNRWHYMVTLARVTASEHGFPAPGLADARKALGV